MPQYTHLFFDLDHTIWDFDTNAKASLQDLYNQVLASKINAPFEDFHARYAYHNAHLWDRYEKGFIGVEDLKWKRMSRALLDFKIGDEKLSTQMSNDFLEILPTKTAVFPHTFEILDYLQAKGYAMHLITNGFFDTQTLKINHSGLAKYFGELITSERSNSLKPKPEIFKYAMEITNAKASQSLMLGDNQHADIGGAINFGMDAVFVNHIKEDVKSTPTYTITHLKELENIL
jgi:putative hydrolase of the HAD superfamily